MASSQILQLERSSSGNMDGHLTSHVKRTGSLGMVTELTQETGAPDSPGLWKRLDAATHLPQPLKAGHPEGDASKHLKEK